MRPFEGVKILDCTHVLAGPFAAYQLAVLGADVIKVEDPNEPDQSRESGADMALNKARMGTGFLTQGSNKRSIALNLKTEGGREALKRLVRDWADVLVENYRPGRVQGAGPGLRGALASSSPKLVYASMTAFGQDGPRGNQTAYDHAIQATSGITASTGTETSGPIKIGAPVIDYATGTMGAFAHLGGALPDAAHRQGPVHRHGDAGRRADPAGLAHHRLLPHRAITTSARATRCALPSRRCTRRATGWCSSRRPTRRQHRRFYEAIGEPAEAERTSLDERHARYDEKHAMIAAQDEGEDRRRSGKTTSSRSTCRRRACASCARRSQDPQLKHRGVLHRHENVPGVGKPVTVPLAAFKFAHDGAVDRAPAAAARRAHRRGARSRRLQRRGDRGAAADRAPSPESPRTFPASTSTTPGRRSRPASSGSGPTACRWCRRPCRSWSGCSRADRGVPTTCCCTSRCATVRSRRGTPRSTRSWPAAGPSTSPWWAPRCWRSAIRSSSCTGRRRAPAAPR